MTWSWDARMSSLDEIRVFVLVEIDHRVSAKIDRVRARNKGGVVEVRIKNLGRQRLPATGRTAIEEASPTRPEAAKTFLNLRNQLVVNGVAIRTNVGGVDRIGVVVELRRVLNLDDQKAREIRVGPGLEKAISLFLLDAIVAMNPEALAVIRLQIRFRRLRAEAGQIGREMAVKDHQGITRLGMR